MLIGPQEQGDLGAESHGAGLRSLPSLDFFAALLFLPAAVTPPVKVARGTGREGSLMKIKHKLFVNGGIPQGKLCLGRHLEERDRGTDER